MKSPFSKIVYLQYLLYIFSMLRCSTSCTLSTSLKVNETIARSDNQGVEHAHTLNEKQTHTKKCEINIICKRWIGLTVKALLIDC